MYDGLLHCLCNFAASAKALQHVVLSIAHILTVKPAAANESSTPTYSVVYVLCWKMCKPLSTIASTGNSCGTALRKTCSAFDVNDA